MHPISRYHRVLAVVLGLVLTSLPAAAETLKYQAKSGETFTKSLVSEPSGTVSVTLPSGTLVCAPSLATLVQNSTGTAFQGQMKRSGDTVSVTGTAGGKAVAMSVPVDPSPWFGDVGLGLAPAVKAGRTKVEFWVVGGKEIQAHKMVAVVSDGGMVTVPAGTFAAKKVVLTVAGVPEFLFKATLFFRAADGVMLQGLDGEKLLSEQ